MTQWGPAEAILRELGIAAPADIDLERIARHRNAAIKRRRLESCEARIVGFGDRAVISVDDRLGDARARFSIAHELGHWHHHRGRTFVCRPDDIGGRGRGTRDPERMADAYAADLLLPDYLFKPMLRQLKPVSLDGVRELSEAFQTSFTATAIRLVEKEPEPAMLIRHGRDGRRWFVRSPRVPKRWIPRAELDPVSPAHEALFGNHPRSALERVGAEVWFDRPEAVDFIVREQSFRAGDGVVTLLLFPDDQMLKISGLRPGRGWR